MRPKLVIGFAAETNDLDLNAMIKLKDKNNNALTVIMNQLTNIIPNLMKQMI